MCDGGVCDRGGFDRGVCDMRVCDRGGFDRGVCDGGVCDMRVCDRGGFDRGVCDSLTDREVCDGECGWTQYVQVSSLLVKTSIEFCVVYCIRL